MGKEEGPAVTAEIRVSRDSTYRIQLTEDWTGEKVESHAYAITAVQDQPPQVAWTRPGRDRQATALEEVLTEARADDDFGLRSLELHYALNGAPAAKLDLFKPRGGRLPRSLSATHTFFLEEFELQPGDFVSYFARASDALATTTSDIYFLEVRPFGKQYRQRQSGSPAGRGFRRPGLAALPAPEADPGSHLGIDPRPEAPGPGGISEFPAAGGRVAAQAAAAHPVPWPTGSSAGH